MFRKFIFEIETWYQTYYYLDKNIKKVGKYFNNDLFWELEFFEKYLSSFERKHIKICLAYSYSGFCYTCGYIIKTWRVWFSSRVSCIYLGKLLKNI